MRPRRSPDLVSAIASGLPRRRRGRRRFVRYRADHLVGEHLLRLAFEAEAPQGAAVELPLDEGEGLLADDHRARPGYRALDAARGVHGVAEHRVLLLVDAADLARHRLARVDADADAEERALPALGV